MKIIDGDWPGIRTVCFTLLLSLECAVTPTSGKTGAKSAEINQDLIEKIEVVFAYDYIQRKKRGNTRYYVKQRIDSPPYG